MALPLDAKRLTPKPHIYHATSNLASHDPSLPIQTPTTCRMLLNGVHHGVSAKHLQAYLIECTFRVNRGFLTPSAHCSEVQEGSRIKPTRSYVPASGSILHVVGVSINRIGTGCLGRAQKEHNVNKTSCKAARTQKRQLRSRRGPRSSLFSSPISAFRAARPSPNSVRQRAGSPIWFGARLPVRCDARATSSGPRKKRACGATASRNR